MGPKTDLKGPNPKQGGNLRLKDDPEANDPDPLWQSYYWTLDGIQVGNEIKSAGMKGRGTKRS